MKPAPKTVAGWRRARRTLLGLLLAGSCLGALAAPAGAVVVGIGDQGPGMFSDPLFLALHIKTARLTVPWNVASSRHERGALAEAKGWIRAAEQDGVTPLISFSGNGNYVPSVGKYTNAVRAFIRRFPEIKLYTPWNEPDWVYRSLSRHPQLAAAYFNALVRSCHHCKVAAGDVYLPAGPLGRWLRAYIKGLRYRPAAWALHDYYDVRQHRTSQLRTMMKLTRGPIWLTEISGVERRGHWQYRNQSAAAAGRDEQFLFSLPHRFHRVARIYHYQWKAVPSAGWDSALISASGRPRPAYYVLKRAATR